MSSYSVDGIKEVFSKFALTIPSIIENLFDDEYKEIVGLIEQSLTLDSDNIENEDPFELVNFMDSLSYYDINIFNQIKQELITITKRDMIKYSALFSFEPIIVIAYTKLS